LWGWGVVGFSHPMFWLWGRLVFWFGLFFGFCWDGKGEFLVVNLCWMGWDRLGEYIAGTKLAVVLTQL
jgi:hypothetical protein